MVFRKRVNEQEAQAWRERAGADLAHLRALSDAARGVEVLQRGFAELPADGERTRIGLSNSLGPKAPAGIGEDDIDVVRAYDALIGPALDWLESAGLLSGATRGRSSLRFYALTKRGRLTLSAGGADFFVPEPPAG